MESIEQRLSSFWVTKTLVDKLLKYSRSAAMHRRIFRNYQAL